jgi:hypothetical protein
MTPELFSFQEKVCHLLYEHYSKRGGFTSTAKAFINKLIGAEWEKDEYIISLEADDKNDAVKKQQVRIDALELENGQLKAKIDKMKKEQQRKGEQN